MNIFRSTLKYSCIVILGMFLIVILLGTLFYKAEFCMFRYGDTSVLLKQNVLYLITGVVVSFIVCKLFFLIIREDKSFDLLKNGWMLLLLYATLQILVIFFFRVKLTADWEVLYNIAKELTTNNYAAFQKGGYLYAYPHNLGITLYLTLLNIIAPGNIYFPRLLNILYSLITIIFLNKTFLLLNPKYKKYTKQFFIMSLLFLPPIFMSNLVYNEIASTMLFLIGIYLSIKFINQQSIKLLLGIAIIFSTANFIRNIGLLFLSATIIYFFLMEINTRKITLLISLAIIGFTLPLWLTNWQLSSKDLISEPLGLNSVPITKWIHIGLNKKYFGYWDQGESYWIYPQEAKWDKKEANRLYQESIKRKLTMYGWSETASIYFKKIVWLWTEGTYQSVYVGMSHSNPGGYIEKTPISFYFEENIKRRDIFKIPMYFGNLTSLITITIFMIYIIYHKAWSFINKELILILLLLAFISFYLTWEVKPRYIYPVFPYILLFAFISYKKLSQRQ